VLDLVVDIFMVVGVLTPFAVFEQWRELSSSRGHIDRRVNL
jgi:hypothetical protein